MTPDQLVAKTQELIRIPSTADNPAALKEAVEYVAAFVAVACPGITIERFEQNGKPSFLAYRGRIRPATFDILLNAHVDVVPGPPELFEPRIQGGRLYGRGALDMKGTAIALAAVFCEVVQAVPYALGLQVVSDEEIGGYDGVRLHINQGVRSKFVVMGEYANDPATIYNAARGLCWAEIAFKGRSAHGGHLWHGSNAVVKAGNFAATVLNHYPTPDRETWTTTASIANLSTPNQTYNKVPDEAVLKIDFRFTQEDPVFATKESLQAFIASIDPEAELVNLATFEPAVNVEPLNPYVQGLAAAIQSVTKTDVQYRGRPGGSDGRHYALVKNDIVEFGLFGKHSHGDGEYVELASFGQYYDTMRQFLHSPLPKAKNKQQIPAAAEPLHITLLRDLVALRTIPGEAAANNKALHFIEHFLAERGMHVERHEEEGFGSLLATTKPGNKKPAVLLTAHTDVVPGKPDQFALRIDDGRLYGRGTLDMKFAIASYLNLVDLLKDNLAAYDFGILITSDEEIGGRKGARVWAAEKDLRPKVAIVPDGGENWRVETFAKGVQWIKLEAAGRAAHASRPWEGSNAISSLLAAISDIRQLIPDTADREGTSLSIGTIEGGTAGNQIPAAASALLDIRYGSMEDFTAIHPRIHAICQAHGITDTLLVSDPPCINDTGNAYIAPFCGLVSAVTGKAPGTVRSYGTTDGRYFSALGVPCIIITPEGDGRHSDNEWLSEQGFEHFNTILARYVGLIARTTEALDTTSPTTAKAGNEHPAEAAPDYVWYAMYGTGLSRENFMCYLRGGRPEGATVTYPGCTDPSLPLADSFMSLPYALYFAGESPVWGGGYVNIHPKPDHRAHTISRAYLITREQFGEIIAQHNGRPASPPLPTAQAVQHGHATIGDGTGDYDELVYCGEKDGYPIFTVTATTPRFPYVPPSLVYTRLVCKGLSEDDDITPQKAISYMLAKPGVAGHYHKKDLVALFNEITSVKPPAPGPE